MRTKAVGERPPLNTLSSSILTHGTKSLFARQQLNMAAIRRLGCPHLWDKPGEIQVDCLMKMNGGLYKCGYSHGPPVSGVRSDDLFGQ